MKRFVMFAALCSAAAMPAFANPAAKQEKKAAVKHAPGHGTNLAPDISVDELKVLVEKNMKEKTTKHAFIVDANGDSSYKESHIPGAVHYKEGTLAEVLKKHNVPKDQPVVAYCGNPMCTAWEAAAKEAKAAGYTDVKHLSAGIKGWREAPNAPLEKKS